MNEMRIVPKWQTYIPHILAIALGWALAMTMDYADEAAEAQQQALRASNDFASCLRGEWRYKSPSGDEFGCYPVELLSSNERIGS